MENFETEAEIDDELYDDIIEVYAEGFVPCYGGGESVPLTTDEILSDAYGDSYREQERLKRFLQRINECNREKARELLFDYLNKGEVHTDIVDLECCFSKTDEIEYLEFNSKEEAAQYLSEHGKIKSMLIVISNASEDEMTMAEIADVINQIGGKDLFQNPDNYEMYFSTISKSHQNFIRMLVQCR